VVRTVAEPLTLVAWVEPAHLPPGGGRVEVFIRVRREGGEPYPGVDIQIATSRGDLESQGRILSSDADGLATDRLRTGRTATLTINAGGTVYRFPVPVLPASADPG
jgi:hypothetical protein